MGEISKCGRAVGKVVNSQLCIINVVIELPSFKGGNHQVLCNYVFNGDKSRGIIV